MQNPSTTKSSMDLLPYAGKTLEKAADLLGFRSHVLTGAWITLALFLIPWTTLCRFYDLNNPLVEPHPIRQGQTALTIEALANGSATVWDYRSPMEGKLWATVMEFPLFQWSAAQVLKLGFSTEVAARLTCLFYFFMGMFFFVKLVRAHFGLATASWAALLYYVSPFTTLFSRTCLIDYCALAFTFAMLHFLFSSLKAEKPHWNYLLFFLAGSLANLAKVTVWATPALIFSLWLVVRWISVSTERKRIAILLGLFGLQLAVALAWISWAKMIRQDDTAGLGAINHNMIIGDLALRLDWKSWLRILTVSARFVLADWMLVPFCLALFLPHPWKGKMVLVLSIALTAILLTFAVHTWHDYYQVADAPVFILVAALGLAALENLKPRFTYLALLLILPLGVNFVRTMPIRFQTVFHDYRPTIQPWKNLSKLTSPNERVYVSYSYSELTIPFYSNRMIVFHSTYGDPTLTPSVFRFEANPPIPPETLLSNHSKGWIDGIFSDYYVYRVEAKDAFQFKAEKNIAFSNEAFAAKAEAVTSLPAVISTCGKSSTNVDLKGVRKTSPVLLVTQLPSNAEIYLPMKDYLSLPGETPGGCKFQLVPSHHRPQTPYPY